MSSDQDTNVQIETAREVLYIEGSALLQMSDYLDKSFSKAIQTILKCQGRTILTGMGKSGHIANKIASTLASTGTPAFFVHPAEAAHGDLGMIVAGDIVIALSNSGESDEILTLVPALKRKGVTIIAITGREQSTLAKISDIHIFARINQEACPLGLAPTTSTTVSLAIGDAIAVCLLKERHFTSNDFALSHPAGSLGKSLLIKAEDIMIKEDDTPVVSTNATLKDVIIVMTNKGLGLAIITDTEKHVLGIFTDGDLRRLFQNEQEIKNLVIKDIMTTLPKTISKDILASEALHLMQKHKIASLLVINNNNQLLGVLTMHQLLKAGIV
ncbi:MAG: KpsF/GutQ family sugar-phosphate isomerase [Neisseriaceae bacterium]|nr:MAG: KpsF/GutQ family sugar-phosphate isomerase [Neisseriaceae bacterium]